MPAGKELFLVQYPCKEPFHEFQLTDIEKQLCDCLYCSARASVGVAEKYHEWKLKERGKK